jgi:hypothetical protein
VLRVWNLFPLIYNWVLVYRCTWSKLREISTEFRLSSKRTPHQKMWGVGSGAVVLSLVLSKINYRSHGPVTLPNWGKITIIRVSHHW